MVRPYLPLNALRAFEASARHLSFTRAAIELRVTQAAVSHQVKALEQRLGTVLFKRLPRGLMITAEGEAVLPEIRDAFDRMAGALGRFDGGHRSEVLMLGAVGTIAVGWLLPRLGGFRAQHPHVDLRLSTNNNRVDLAAEGLDYAIRFGNGAWQGTDATPLFEAPLSVLCQPSIGATLHRPEDVLRQTLLRSYRAEEWANWLAAAGVAGPVPVVGTLTFDSSLAMMEAALQGAGLALCPPKMFARQIALGLLAQPFDITTSMGSYWLTRLQSREETPAMSAFRNWLMAEVTSEFSQAGAETSAN
ncbi:LysR family transcriptional regulator [Aureimonas sp. SA4125]|uniref:LysR family transcriptional regulator n=1 Tax=Aureimonas sp. SA4125 TaxID=2826993 RepID=UPI001CC7067B|nr:LysR family transcriptional regulator [Aureimonas sp. SA4125]